MTRTASLVLAALLAAALPAADKPDRDAGAKKAIGEAIAVLKARLEKEAEPTARDRLRYAIKDLEHARDMAVLTPQEELAAFVADPGKHKGGRLNLHLTYVGTAPLRDRRGQEKVEFEAADPATKKAVRVLIDLPKSAYLGSGTDDGRGAALSVFFECRDGRLDAGNVAATVWVK